MIVLLSLTFYATFCAIKESIAQIYRYIKRRANTQPMYLQFQFCLYLLSVYPIIGISAVKSHSGLLTTNGQGKINIERFLWRKTCDKHRMEMSVQPKPTLRSYSSDRRIQTESPRKWKYKHELCSTEYKILGTQEQVELSQLSSARYIVWPLKIDYTEKALNKLKQRKLANRNHFSAKFKSDIHYQPRLIIFGNQ